MNNVLPGFIDTAAVNEAIRATIPAGATAASRRSRRPSRSCCRPTRLHHRPEPARRRRHHPLGMTRDARYIARWRCCGASGDRRWPRSSVASSPARRRHARRARRPARAVSGPPNCVSSQATDDAHRIAPFALRGDAAVAMAAPRVAIVGDAAGATIVRAARRLPVRRVRQRTLMGFVDDVEFVVDAPARVIHVRSAVAAGHGDLGVNRKRVEALRAERAATNREARDESARKLARGAALGLPLPRVRGGRGRHRRAPSCSSGWPARPTRRPPSGARS